MRFQEVNRVPIFVCNCIRCGKSMQSDKEFKILADLDGEPFKAYYCSPCKETVEFQHLSSLKGENNS